MPYVDESVFYPKYAGKEISFMMYNCNNIEHLIDERKNEMIGNINVTNSAWLKSRKQKGYSLEDIVVSFDEDRRIMRLKKWQTFLISFFNILKTYEKPLYYQFIELKFIRKLDDNEIMKQLDITVDKLRNLEIRVKWIAYKYAIKDKLFNEEVLENAPV